MSSRKNMVILGTTGTGKSSLGNILLSGDPFKELEKHFRVCSSAQSCTKTCEAIDGYFAGNTDRRVRIIDTPGFGDKMENVEELRGNLTEGLKNEKEVHAFIWAINAESPRFTGQDQDTLRIMIEIFGAAFLSNLTVVFTRFSHSKHHERIRRRTGRNMEQMKTELCDNYLGHATFITDIDANFNPSDNDEKKAFQMNSDSLWNEINKHSLTPVEHIEDVEKKYRDLQQRIAELEAELKHHSDIDNLENARLRETLKALRELEREYFEQIRRTENILRVLKMLSAGSKISLKVATHGSTKWLVTVAAKQIPFLGAVIGAGLGTYRLIVQGDSVGALGELASGAASCVPGLGTLVSVCVDAALVAYDVAN